LVPKEAKLTGWKDSQYREENQINSDSVIVVRFHAPVLMASLIE
jgi:hypothetical protein